MSKIKKSIADVATTNEAIKNSLTELLEKNAKSAKTSVSINKFKELTLNKLERS